MSNVHRTIIVPAGMVNAARQLGKEIAPGCHGMYTTGLSPTGKELNPLMARMMGMVGVIPALAIMKGAMLYFTFTNLGIVILYLPLFVAVYIGVCAWNLYQIRKGF